MIALTPTLRLSRAVLLALAMALIAGACAGDSSDADDAAAAAADSAATTVEEELAAPDTSLAEASDDVEPYDPTTASLEFEGCGDGFECAMFDVPLDYDEPTGETVQIHITRQEASGERIGTLFLNPGGPGFGAEDMVRGLGQFGPPPVVEAFDLIGIDPRGTGRSGPIDCNTDDAADELRKLSFDDADLDEYIEDFRDLAATCEERYDLGYLASLTTVNAARDMESVRLALGGEPLNFYGASYGTAIGSVFATMYPDSIRTMVLDAAVPTDPADGTFESRAAEVELALTRLDTSCDLWLDCPVADVGLLEAIDEIAETLETEGSIGNLDHARFNAAIGALVPAPDWLFDVAPALAEALDGSGSALAQIGVGQLTRIPDSEALATNSGSTQAIVCADGWNLENSTVDELAGQAERTAAAAPNAGGAWETPCDLWPVTGAGIPAVSYRGDAPILVIGNEGDAITPLRWSEDLAAELGPGATLLVSEATGHTIAFQRPGCVDDHVFALLLDEVLPEEGSRCGAPGLVGIGHTDGPVVVTRVTSGSPAEAAGVQIDDRIIEANGSPVEFWYDMPQGSLGDPLDLVVDRGGEIVELSMVRGPTFHEFWRLADDAAG
ncbi:MAG: alpha/beta fold hydrolase [Actinomycetota bacterium]